MKSIYPAYRTEIMHRLARIEAIFGKLILPFITLIPDSGAETVTAPRIRQNEQLQRLAV